MEGFSKSVGICVFRVYMFNQEQVVYQRLLQIVRLTLKVSVMFREHLFGVECSLEALNS